jgi:hypothetical protein
MVSPLPLLPILALGAWPEPRPFNMNDLSARSAAGVETMYGDMDIDTVLGPRNVDFFMLHLVGDFVVTPNVKLGVRMPFSYVDCTDCFGPLLNLDDEQLAVGNLTLGARYGIRQQDTLVAVGISYSGLTASDDYEDDGRAAALTSLFMLFREPGWFLPDAHTLRIGGDVRLGFGRGFFQGQLAFHQIIAEEVDDNGVDGDPDYSVIRVVAGGGVGLTEHLAAMGELVVTTTILDSDDDDNPFLFNDEEFFYVLDLGVRYEALNLSFGGRVSLPLEYGNIDDPVGVGVDLLGKF